ncbi:MAG: metal ABC transporter ATP-binding protein [Bacillota bacterium]
MERPVITLKNISFAYQSAQILKQITFSIEKSEFVGFVGPNGAGKSTLIKIILGLIKPNHGEITILGKPLHQFGDWSKIGYIPQKATAFNPSFPATVEEIVAAPLLASFFLPRYPAKIAKKVDEVLKIVDLLEQKKCLIGNLSGGQQQRAFLARTLIHTPEILILDEPFIGIDEYSQRAILNTLVDLNSKGTTILMITHDLRWIKEYISVIICIENSNAYIHQPKEYCTNVQYHDH